MDLMAKQHNFLKFFFKYVEVVLLRLVNYGFEKG